MRLAWISITSYVQAFVGHTPKELLDTDLWEASQHVDKEGIPAIVVGRILGDGLAIWINGDPVGGLRVLIAIADSAADPPDYDDATILIQSDSGLNGRSLAVLARLDANVLGIVSLPGEGTRELYAALEATQKHFDLTIRCALWTGDHTIGVGANGMAPKVRSLRETVGVMTEVHNNRGRLN